MIDGELVGIIQMKIWSGSDLITALSDKNVFACVTAVVHEDNDVGLILAHSLFVSQKLLTCGIAGAAKVDHFEAFAVFVCCRLIIEQTFQYLAIGFGQGHLQRFCGGVSKKRNSSSSWCLA